MSIKSDLKRTNFIIYAVTSFVVLVILWSSVATIDEVVKGIGTVKTQKDVQAIQSLEGGIIREILVDEGEYVEAGQPLVRLDDIAFRSALAELDEEISGLEASKAQLRAQLAATEEFSATGSLTEIDIEDFYTEKMGPAVKRSVQSGYSASITALLSESNTVSQRVSQAVESLSETTQTIRYLEDNLTNLQEELALNERAFEAGAISGVELLQVRRSVTDSQAELDRTRSEQERKSQQLAEYRFELSSVADRYRSDVQNELNTTESQLAQRQSSQVAISDRVYRTILNSPVSGSVKMILSSTSGGIVQGGETILEVVPDDTSLIVEVEINPADIGYLRPGLNSLVKLSAYDFVIYGGIDGNLTNISADTIVNEEGKSHYLGRVELSGNVTQFESTVELIPGMQAEVDIVVGKKTILQYWLKPILRAKYNSMKEV
ncbi:MAG: HlyD family type I secretion periplasmic adaptor subunit [Pseudomonadales bacterium]|jgi:adhesin transport system membrane fusion protein